jgi:hypothetical protein
MNRKVVKQGNNMMTLTLPRSWVVLNNIQPGQNLEVNCDRNSLNIVANPSKDDKKIEIDISGYDRTTILFVIRAAYRKGYDEVYLKFDNQSVVRFRNGKKYNVMTVINYEVGNLIGYEVINFSKNSCLIRDVSQITDKDFDLMLRRVFLLIKQSLEDYVEGISSGDFELLGTMEGKHDSITKFVSYCMRILSKSLSQRRFENTVELYRCLGIADDIADTVKYSAREILEGEVIFSSKSAALPKHRYNSTVFSNLL